MSLKARVKNKTITTTTDAAAFACSVSRLHRRGTRQPWPCSRVLLPSRSQLTTAASNHTQPAYGSSARPIGLEPETRRVRGRPVGYGGAAVRTLHDAPLPPWPARNVEDVASRLAAECQWLIANDVLPAEVITRDRRLAERALRPWRPVFIHGDLQVDHVFRRGQGHRRPRLVRGVPRRRLFDLATLTFGHPDHLNDVIAGYGTDVDRDLNRAWWSMRCLTNVRWLTEVGIYGPPESFPEVAVLGSQM